MRVTPYHLVPIALVALMALHLPSVAKDEVGPARPNLYDAQSPGQTKACVLPLFGAPPACYSDPSPKP